MDKLYIMSTRGLDKTGFHMFPHGKVNRLGNYIGQELIGLSVIDPLSKREIPIVANSAIDDSITHILPICPSLVPADFKLSEVGEIDRGPCVGYDGKIISRNGNIHGLSLFQNASEGILLELSTQQTILDYTEEASVVWYKHKSQKDPIYMTYTCMS